MTNTTPFDFIPAEINYVDLPRTSPDIQLVTEQENFGAKAQGRRVNRVYNDSSSHVIWQCDVYYEAFKIAERLGLTRVIDLGCGTGDKLASLFPPEKFDTIGFDTPNSIETARSAHPDREWRELWLNSYRSIFDTADFCALKNQPCMIILSDVIEHLPDPRLAILLIKMLLLMHDKSRVVISTPDRARTHGRSNLNCPMNGAHVREWTLQELAALLTSAGLKIEKAGFTRANQFDPGHSTCFLMASCPTAFYRQFLVDQGLCKSSPQNVQRLIITGEHGLLSNTGGIGSYLVELAEITPTDSFQTIVFRNNSQLDRLNLRRKKILTASDLLSAEYVSKLPVADQAYAAAEQFLFYFPWLKTIEYQDWSGIGVRIAQAKRTGHFPPRLRIEAGCHGSGVYTEHANRAWIDFAAAGDLYSERESIENADIIRIPTQFLLEFYRSRGYYIPQEKVLYERLPFRFDNCKPQQYRGIDTLIFMGKRNEMKGFPDFLEAVELLLEQGTFGLKRVIIVGRKVGESGEIEGRLQRIREKVTIEELSLNRCDVISFLRERASHSILVLPYTADNHPNAVLEAINTLIPFLAYGRGGIPELIPETYHASVLADASANDLVRQLNRLNDMAPSDRKILFERCRDDAVGIQDEINRSITERYAHPIAQPEERIIASVSPSDISVICCVFNTRLDYISELCRAINSQLLAPQEVIFVNDCSYSSYTEKFLATISAELRTPYRILTHSENRGLAAARNTALAAIQTPYFVNIDSDDIPLPSFLFNIAQAFHEQPSVAAVVPYLEAFDDGTNWNSFGWDRYVYRPLGAGLITAQVHNTLGHANSGFNTEIIRALDGWDGKTKSMWEDWELYLKIVSRGHKIQVIPKVDILYRVRAASMARTYSKFDAMVRVSNGTSGGTLSLFDSLRLQAVVRQVDNQARAIADQAKVIADQEGEINGLIEQNRNALGAIQNTTARRDFLEKQYDRAAIRIARRMIDMIERRRWIYRPLRWIGRQFAPVLGGILVLIN